MLKKHRNGKNGYRVISDGTYGHVMALYGNRCVSCLESASHLHHLLPKSVHPNYSDDVDNLCPLCVSCHTNVHTTKTLRKWSVILHEKKRRLRRLYE